MEKEDAPVLIQKEENSHMVEKDMLEKVSYSLIMRQIR
jgi:hypothetical protein